MRSRLVGGSTNPNTDGGMEQPTSPSALGRRSNGSLQAFTALARSTRGGGPGYGVVNSMYTHALGDTPCLAWNISTAGTRLLQVINFVENSPKETHALV